MPKSARTQTGSRFAPGRGTNFARPSFTTKRTFLAVLFLGLFAMAARNVDDPDVWWHLKTGEYIAAHKSVPHTDPFSYTRAGQPWVAHEWLTELGLYEIQRSAGFAGLILVFAAILTAAFVLLYLRCGPAAYIAGVMTLWGALAARPVWGVRPQVISLLLTSLWLFILERAEKNAKLVWWTLPLTLLWVNLHAGFALGIAISALFIAGSLTERIFHCEAHRLWLPVAVFALDLLLVPLNPNGLRMFSYPFETLRSTAMQKYIAEWASPNFHRAEYWPFLLLVLATFVALGCSRISLRPNDLLLLLVSLFASLVSIRMIPFFVLIAVPIVCRLLGVWPRIDPNLRKRAFSRDKRAFATAFNIAIVTGMILFAVIHSRQVIQQQATVENNRFPARAVAFLHTHPPSGPMFNYYDWGGFLIWKLYPPLRVFIDGRADVYGEKIFQDFADAYGLKDSWKQILQRWHIQTVLVPSDSALATALRADPAWKVAYQDSQATILMTSGESREMLSPSKPAKPSASRMVTPVCI
jgi:hypothetical protein